MPHDARKKTSLAFIGSSFLKAPFWAMYALLVFILTKELNASSLQITWLIALKPIASLISPYWSALIHNRADRLKSNVVLATIIAHVPFFFFPLLDHPWFVVAAATLFLLMKRGIIPAWMELLKRNLSEKQRQKTFSTGSILSYTGGALLPILFGWWMDTSPGAWRYLFPLTSLLSLAGTLFMIGIPVQKRDTSQKSRFSLKEALKRPWINSYRLLQTRPDFTRFQMGFMLGGGGLMVMQRALPAFFILELHLSYTVLAIAIATCKGIGFALTSRLWAKLMDRFSLFRFSSLVTTLAALFPLCLLMAKLQLSWIYIAYLVYGVMQAGSELSWHLSGPIFAKDEESSAYSSVNVATVGLRGLIAPYCGALLCAHFSPTAALLLGGVLCALGSVQLTAAHSWLQKKFSS